MDKLLFITRDIPGSLKCNDGGRSVLFCKSFAKVASVYLLPMNYDWGDDSSEVAIRNLGIRFVFPRQNSSQYIVKFLLENEIDTVVFSQYAELRCFYRLLPFFKNVVVDEMDAFIGKEYSTTKTKNSYYKYVDIFVTALRRSSI